jgi:hypothetical protein
MTLTGRYPCTDLGSVDASVAAISPGIEATEHQSHHRRVGHLPDPVEGVPQTTPGPHWHTRFPVLGFPLEKVINTPSKVREFVHRVKQSIICSHNMTAPSMCLVRSVKKHRRHSETSLVRGNTDKARTSAIESPACFSYQRTLSTTSAMQEGNLRLTPDKSFESTNGKHLTCRRRAGACANLVMQSMRRWCSEPPSHALDGLLRSTPPQFAALGTIVAVIIIIAVTILSLCSCSLIRARRGV